MKSINESFGLLQKIILVILDLIALNAIFWFVNSPLAYQAGVGDKEAYSHFRILTNCCWILSAMVFRIYDPATSNKFKHQLRQVTRTYLLFISQILIYLFSTNHFEYPGTALIVSLLALPLLILLNRSFSLALWGHFRTKNRLAKRILIIGYNDVGKKLAAQIEKQRSQLQMVGYCEDYNKINELSKYPIIDEVDDVISTCVNHNVTDIFSTILPEQDFRISKLMNDADQHCIRFKLVPDFHSSLTRPMHLHYLSDIPVLATRHDPLEEITNRVKKRFFDIMFSLFMIVFVLSWLVPVVALLIMLESRGPVFFIQRRSGRNNTIFYCIKFRSMKVNQAADRLQAVKNDARLTRIGMILRKTNIDEFPQFFNVLAGDMSIVGPRPHMVKHTEDYSRLINNYMIRQLLKPGITGWAQVNGFRGETRRIEDMESRVDHDIWYLESWTFLLDLKIIALTVLNIFKGEKNAY